MQAYYTLAGNAFQTTFFNESSFEFSFFYQSSPGFVETSPAFFKGKSECRVRVFLESGLCTGTSFAVCLFKAFLSILNRLCAFTRAAA